MRRFRLVPYILLLAVVAILSGCAEKIEERDKTTVLIYVAGDNNLSYYASDCLEQLKEGFIPSESPNADNLLIYYDIPGQSPTLFKVTRTENDAIRQNVLVTYPEDQLSADAETLTKVINDAQFLCPAKRNALILWSHSTGFLHQGYYDELWYGRYEGTEGGQSPLNKVQKKTFGKDYDSSKEIELVDLADAIPFKFDYIFFDSCLMGCVEVAYELREKCDYLVVSPTEIMAQGMPYYMMMDQIFNNSDREAVVTAIAKEYYEYYCTHNGGCTIVAVRTAALETLASSVAEIIEKNGSALTSLNRNVIQHYDRCDEHWMFDMDQIMSLVATDGYSSFASALDAATVYKAATPSFLEINIHHYGGLGMYLPITGAPKMNYYYKKLAWNKATLLVR